MRLLRVVLFLLCLSVASRADAWDGVVSQRIYVVDMGAPSGNYPTRVELVGQPALCGNANTWAYVADTDGNYKAVVSLLLVAKATNAAVVLYTTRDAGTGFCRIGYARLM